MSFPLEHGNIPVRYVGLPEGRHGIHPRLIEIIWPNSIKLTPGWQEAIDLVTCHALGPHICLATQQ